MSTDTDDDQPDLPLFEDEQALLDALSESTIREIDSALLTNCAHSWRKVARVVGTTMMTQPFKEMRLPDVCYATRVVALVNQRKLESAGNLNYMRYSEIRLPQDSESAMRSSAK
ncbi:DUF3658 domain-containing protein [Acidovorax kalamii]|jgi:hypothetical protein|uniref:DUF3658 domain-containing protein n=1 Tax=Acidovorax TaxID=12916 RepID=UPI0020914FEA|nr:DUF3658 domain-containing protein [Acidovorax kalamii]MCO5356070.1 DUF3658 domain-containing protein [Acidovorax kalamii]